MGVVSRAFAEVGWRRGGLSARKPRGGVRHQRKRDGVAAQEGTRRGRAAAMRVVAAVHALRLRGTEKCPFDFATDGDSADSL